MKNTSQSLVSQSSPAIFQRQSAIFQEREREIIYLTTHSTHFIYDYMASDIWLRTILIVRKETRCRHIGYSYRLTARVLLYAPSNTQDNTYHSLCYTSRGALAGTRNSSMGPTPWRIDPTSHRTMSERSTSELCPAPHFFKDVLCLQCLLPPCSKLTQCYILNARMDFTTLIWKCTVSAFPFLRLGANLPAYHCVNCSFMITLKSQGLTGLYT